MGREENSGEEKRGGQRRRIKRIGIEGGRKIEYVTRAVQDKNV